MFTVKDDSERPFVPQPALIYYIDKDYMAYILCGLLTTASVHL